MKTSKIKCALIAGLALSCTLLTACSFSSDGLIPEEDRARNDVSDAEVHQYVEPAEETTGEGVSYKNGKVWNVKFKNGVTVTVGVEGETDGKGIYLSPTCSESKPLQQTGYYYQVQNHGLEACNQMIAAEANSELNKDAQELAIVGHAFEDVVPADYVNASAYGLRWFARPTDCGKTTDVVDIRAVRLTDNYLYGIVRVYIEADKDGVYEIKKVCDADVSVTGEATAAEREELCQKAAEFMMSKNSGLSSQDWSVKKLAAAAVVHAPVDTYFKNLVGPEREPLIRGRLGTYELYAVTMPINYGSSSNSGGATVYLTHQSYLWGFGEPTAKEDFPFVIVGRDAYYPQTENGMIW